jgi:hypothetical protein
VLLQSVHLRSEKSDAVFILESIDTYVQSCNVKYK